jgi:hypothetical protein
VDPEVSAVLTVLDGGGRASDISVNNTVKMKSHKKLPELKDQTILT